MADDLIELGIEGADKIIDKHFHKLPDSALHADTYKHPFSHGSRRRAQHERRDDRDTRRSERGGDERDTTREKRRDSVWEEQESLAEQGRHRRHQSQERASTRKFDTEWDNNNNNLRRSPSPRSTTMSQHINQQPYRDGRPSNDANSTMYTQDGPFVTAPWTTLPDYHAPAAQGFSPRPSRQYDPDNYRPAQMRRRSSSYHGPRGRDRFYSDDSELSSDSDSDRRSRRGHGGHARSQHGNQQLTRHNDTSHGNSSAAYARSERTSKSHSHSHEHKDTPLENLKDNFTDSPQGIAGSALGAIVGGYVTHKALETRNHGREQSNRDKALTLLGAVVSGVAINAVVDKFEDRRREKEVEEKGERGKRIQERFKREEEREDRRERDRDRGSDGYGRDRRARSERGSDRRDDRDYYR